MNNNKPSLTSRFLWYCAASDAQVLQNNCTKSVQRWHRILGTFIIITSLAAFYSGYKAFDYIVGSIEGRGAEAVLSTYGPVVAGLIWSLVVFNVDRLLIASIQKSAIQYKYRYETNKVKLFFGRFIDNIKYWFGLVLRIVIGVAIAASISFIVEMSIFEPQIQVYLNNDYRSEVERKNRALNNVGQDSLRLLAEQANETRLNSELQVTDGYLKAINTHPDVKPLFDAYEAERIKYNSANQALREARNKRTNKYNELINDPAYYLILAYPEGDKKELTPQGEAQLASFDSRVENLEDRRNRVRNDRNRKKKLYDDKVAIILPELQDKKSALVSDKEASESVISDVTEVISVKTENAENDARMEITGFGAKANAFQKLRSSDNTDARGIQLIAYGLLFIFLLIELLPIVTKYLGTASSYDDNVYVNDQILKKAASIKLKTAMDFFDSSKNEDLDV